MLLLEVGNTGQMSSQLLIALLVDLLTLRRIIANMSNIENTIAIGKNRFCGRIIMYIDSFIEQINC